MKKIIIAMLVAFCSSLLLAGCGDSEQQKKDAEAKRINEQLWKDTTERQKNPPKKASPLDDRSAGNEAPKI